MTFFDAAPKSPLESYTSELRPRRGATPRPSQRATANAPRRANRAGAAKRARIQAWLRVAPSGLSISELAALVGCSRQLCLYHVKRLAAEGALSGVTAVLEPCARNGGVQYRVWSDERLVDAVLQHGAGAWRARAA
jgi:hypothetical protein